jgi:DNA-binding Lrp family transcriptional regulator
VLQTLAQTTLSRKLGISQQWIGELVSRLEREEWIEHYSPKLSNGANGSTIFRVGRMLKRLLVMRAKSKQRKSSTPKPAKCHWHFSPRELEKDILSIQQRENENSKPETLSRIPLLGAWIDRGT